MEQKAVADRLPWLEEQLKRKMQSMRISRVSITVCIAVCLLVSVILINVFKYGFWRHDSMIYLQNYYHQLISDGRWGNALLFPILHNFPGWFLWACAFGCFYWFFFFIARRTFGGNVFAFATAAIVMASPALYSQLNWPGTTLPAAAVIALSTWLVSRVRYVILLPFLSIVLFGMYSWTIYLLPLLYLNRQFTSYREATAWWGRFIGLWGASFVAGFLVMQHILLALFGSGIKLAWHRRPDPAGSIEHLLVNLWENTEVAVNHMLTLAPATPALFMLVAVITCMRWQQCSEASRRAALTLVSIGLIIAFCHYVLVAPSGIRIDYRSAFPLHVGLALSFLSLSFLYKRTTTLALIGALMGLPSWYMSVRSTEWFATISQTMRDDVSSNIPEEFRTRNIIVDATRHKDHYRYITHGITNQVFPFFEILDDPQRWVRAMTEEGFSNVKTCPQYIHAHLTDECLQAMDRLAKSGCDIQHTTICIVELGDRVLLRLQAPPGERAARRSNPATWLTD